MKEKIKLLFIKFLISLVVIFPISFITSILLFESITSTAIISLTSLCMSLVLSVGHTFVPNDEEDIGERIEQKQEKIEVTENIINENKTKQFNYFESFVEQNEIIKIKVKQRENF